jgi:hypothetical protein
VLDKVKEVAGEILIGAATGAALTAVSVAAEAVDDLVEVDQKNLKKSTAKTGGGSASKSTGAGKSAKSSSSAKSKSAASSSKKSAGGSSKTGSKSAKSKSK